VSSENKPLEQNNHLGRSLVETSLVTFDTKVGKLGGLICWKFYMPLAEWQCISKELKYIFAPTAGFTLKNGQTTTETNCFGRNDVLF